MKKQRKMSKKMIIQMVKVDIRMTKKSHWRENILSERVSMQMMIVKEMKMLLQVHAGAQERRISYF